MSIEFVLNPGFWSVQSLGLTLVLLKFDMPKKRKIEILEIKSSHILKLTIFNSFNVDKICSFVLMFEWSGFNYPSDFFTNFILINVCSKSDLRVSNTSISYLSIKIGKGVWGSIDLKGGFYSESAIRFLDLQISKTKYSEKLSWAWNLNLLFTVFGGKFKFQTQDSFPEYFFLEIWRSEKRIALSEKKTPLRSIRWCSGKKTDVLWKY